MTHDRFDKACGYSMSTYLDDVYSIIIWRRFNMYPNAMYSTTEMRNVLAIVLMSSD